MRTKWIEAPKTSVPADPPAQYLGFADPSYIMAIEKHRTPSLFKPAVLFMTWHYRKLCEGSDVTSAQQVVYRNLGYIVWDLSIDWAQAERSSLDRDFMEMTKVIWQRPAPVTAQSWPLAWWVMLIVGALVSALRAGSEFRYWRTHD